MPEQKGLLVALARETGKPLPALIAEALERLQAHVYSDCTHDTTHKRYAARAGVTSPPAARKPIWEQFIEAFQDVPEEKLERLPVDGAAQHDTCSVIDVAIRKRPLRNPIDSPLQYRYSTRLL